MASDQGNNITMTVEVGDATNARTAEAWAVGQRGGVDVGSDDPTYQNNSKYYAEQAGASETNAAESEENAEAWAVGQRGGTDVTSEDPTYQNNAKHYSQQAGNSATAAGTSETNAAGSEGNAEAWAVGERGGVDVSSDDPTYHNNSKYYAEQAGDAQEAAETAMTKYPKVENGYWYVWDPENSVWVNTEVAAQGPQGETGATGATGVTPNFTVGTVTTLPAGSSATVTISGTAEDPVMSMGIPKGDDPSFVDIETAVDAWLTENITNPDSPPLDRSLSQANAAAPADLVGDLDLLKEDIPGTTATVTFSAGKPASIVHEASGTAVRTDTFTWGTNTVTETRTLADGTYITITTNLDTLVSVVSAVTEGA